MGNAIRLPRAVSPKALTLYYLLRNVCYVFACLAAILFGAFTCLHNKPPEPVVAPVVVESTCTLPPKPELPTPKAHRPGDGDLICFTPEEANKLRERDAKLKQWVREVLARCREETQDAGSNSTED